MIPHTFLFRYEKISVRVRGGSSIIHLTLQIAKRYRIQRLEAMRQGSAQGMWRRWISLRSSWAYASDSTSSDHCRPHLLRQCRSRPLPNFWSTAIEKACCRRDVAHVFYQCRCRLKHSKDNIGIELVIDWQTHQWLPVSKSHAQLESLVRMIYTGRSTVREASSNEMEAAATEVPISNSDTPTRHRGASQSYYPALLKKANNCNKP